MEAAAALLVCRTCKNSVANGFHLVTNSQCATIIKFIDLYDIANLSREVHNKAFPCAIDLTAILTPGVGVFIMIYRLAIM